MTIETQLNELSPADREALNAVVQRLRHDLPDREPAADLSGRILAAVADERAREGAPMVRKGWWRLCAFSWRKVACVAALSMLVLTPLVRMCLCTGAINADLQWLAQHQDADGSWSPARYGGSESYRPALTALALLALNKDSSRYASHIQHAVAALQKMQASDGSFGGVGQARYYNQALTLATMAHMTATQPGVAQLLARAVQAVDQWQLVSGGWDYLSRTEGNAALTSWFVQGLARAEAQGIAGASRPLRKGLRWLSKVARDDGSIAYHADSAGSSDSLNALAAYTLMVSGRNFDGLPALGERVAGMIPATASSHDAYRDFSKCRAFLAAGQVQKANQVRGEMAHRQQSGAADAWQSVGGQVYLAALSALTAR